MRPQNPSDKGSRPANIPTIKEVRPRWGAPERSASARSGATWGGRRTRRRARACLACVRRCPGTARRNWTSSGAAGAREWRHRAGAPEHGTTRKQAAPAAVCRPCGARLSGGATACLFAWRRWLAPVDPRMLDQVGTEMVLVGESTRLSACERGVRARVPAASSGSAPPTLGSAAFPQTRGGACPRPLRRLRLRAAGIGAAAAAHLAAFEHAHVQVRGGPHEGLRTAARRGALHLIRCCS